MFQDDYILREIEYLCRFLAKALFHKETQTVEILDENGNVSEAGLLYQRLKSMVDERRVNEAEDLLFDEFEEHPDELTLSVAVLFYNDLLAIEENELEDADFSRQEILEGLEEIRALYAQTHPDETPEDIKGEYE